MIADFHNDFLTYEKRYEVLKEYAKSNNCIVGVIFRGKRDLNFAESTIKFLMLNRSPNIYFSFEDFGYEEDISVISDRLLVYNPAYVGLTWNYENNLAFGANFFGGLKKRGKEIIRQLNKKKIPLDVAHLCEQSFFDAVEIADSILCSHTCFYDLRPHPRNLKNEEIEIIVKNGGLIGLTLYTPFLTDKKRSDIKDVIRHIDYFVQKHGCDNLAIGTDFYGCENFPEGFDDYAFEYLLRDYLLKFGYSLIDIDKILYYNLQNFLNKRKTVFKNKIVSNT